LASYLVLISIKVNTVNNACFCERGDIEKQGGLRFGYFS
jgi:hypothetical protein